MEAYFKHFPSPLHIDGERCVLIITRINDFWTVGYETKRGNFVIYRWNKSLYTAMRMLETWLRIKGLWVEEENNLNSLEKYLTPEK